MRGLIVKENKLECMQVGEVEKPSRAEDRVRSRLMNGGVYGTRLHIRMDEMDPRQSPRNHERFFNSGRKRRKGKAIDETEG